MGWAWSDFEDCPQDIVDRLLRQLKADAEQREADERLREQKRRHGRP